MKIFAKNKRAFFDYEIIEKYEAGIELFGFEVKSIKKGSMSLKGAFVFLKNNEIYLINALVPPYQLKNNPKDYNPERTRKLLLRKEEIKILIGKSNQKGLTLIPLQVYNRGSKIKVEIALAKNKKKFQKKQKLKEKDIKREMERDVREKLK